MKYIYFSLFLLFSTVTYTQGVASGLLQLELIEPPVFSLAPGFYTGGQLLEITHPDPLVSIYYSLDGSPPTQESNLYSGPLTLLPVQADANDMSLKRTNPVEADPKGFGWKPPVAYQKAMVVQAIACNLEAGCSLPVSGTFFTGIEVPSLPVVSIIIDPHQLFDHHDGIYIPGIFYEENGFGNNWYGYPNANYFQRGEEIEIPSWFEFYENGQAALGQMVGVRLHGGGTRAMPMKSLRIYARSDYGQSTLDHTVFPGQQRSDYKRILLRNGGQDFFGPGTLLRDGLLQKMAEPLNVAIQDYRPAILFLNGEYWGIHNLRERYDRHYFENKYRIPQNLLDFLENNKSVLEGSATHYQAMLDFISLNQIDDPQVYSMVQTMMDTDNFIDYYITNIYNNNIDWPGNNFKFWRKQVHYQPNAAWGHDGRWRWALMDKDFSYGWDDPLAFANNTLAHATATNGSDWPPNQAWSTWLIRQLLENPEFNEDFISRFADLLNTLFSEPHVLANIQQKSEAIESSMPRQIDRWGYPAADMDAWRSNVEGLKTFATQRPAHQKQHILDYFGLSGTFRLTVDVEDPATGTVQVNKLNIAADNPLLEHSGSSLPWTGEYFNQVSFPLLAIPAEGYKFQKWITGAGEERFDNPLRVKVSADLELKAVFSEELEPPVQLSLMHYWHFNDLPAEELQAVVADHSFSGNAVLTYPGTGLGYMDRVEDGTILNALDEELSGFGLRLRNPSGTRHLELKVPTHGYDNIRLSYAVKRTSSGAQEQTIFYRIDDAAPWMQMGSFYAVGEEYELVTTHFSFPEATNNPSFAIRIEFSGSNALSEFGNNRFDNIRLEGIPMDGTNIPPYVVEQIPLQLLVENGDPISLDLSGVFTDEDNDPLTYSVSSSHPETLAATVEGHWLTLTPLQRGDARITLMADDAHNAPVSTLIRGLIYPQAFDIRDAVFSFAEWNADQPQGAFPANMLFLQSDTDDPGIDEPLLFAYNIPHEDYHADDLGTLGFPYNNTARTRINGLEANGISFINTGRGRDIGGALLAINTTAQTTGLINFLAGTLSPNSRIYNLRLQYRVGVEGDFMDVPDEMGNPVEYRRNLSVGHNTTYLGIPIPQQAMGQEYVQLLWRYYYTGIQVDAGSGHRTQIRLDNILVGEVSTGIVEKQNLRMRLYPNPAVDHITMNIEGLPAGKLLWEVAGIQGGILLEGNLMLNGDLQHSLNVSALTPGVYIIRLITGQEVVSRRFVKSRGW